MKRVFFMALTVGIATAAITMSQRSRAAQVNASNEAREAGDVNKIPLKLPLVDPRIAVTKSKRQLALYSGEKLVRLYNVGLGFSPKDDKARQGDGCTPEGSFYVCVKNPQSSFYLSLGLSYPNKEHAERGLRDRVITRAQYNEIISAIERGERPPWNTPLGGEIFIHGHGSQSDWTWGCVALDNDDMKELYDAVPKGTKVVIEP